MAKTLNGLVTSVLMKDTITVKVSRRIPHKLYKKLMARSKKYKVAVGDEEVSVGDFVEISEIKPISKDKYFKLAKIITSVKEVKHG